MLLTRMGAVFLTSTVARWDTPLLLLCINCQVACCWKMWRRLETHWIKKITAANENQNDATATKYKKLAPTFFNQHKKTFRARVKIRPCRCCWRRRRRMCSAQVFSPLSGNIGRWEIIINGDQTMSSDSKRIFIQTKGSRKTLSGQEPRPLGKKTTESNFDEASRTRKLAFDTNLTQSDKSKQALSSRTNGIK